MKQACRSKDLSFLWISDEKTKKIVKDLEEKRIKINVLLDTEATYNKPDDLYARLAYAVKDSGGIVINDPDRAVYAIDKSILSYELLDRKILTPYTMIVRKWQPHSFKLSDKDKLLSRRRGRVPPPQRGSV